MEQIITNLKYQEVKLKKIKQMVQNSKGFQLEELDLTVHQLLVALDNRMSQQADRGELQEEPLGYF